MARVLVVDDDRDTAESFARLLTRWGHEPRVCFSGAEALAQAASFRPRVALLDLAMPGMTGAEVASRLRLTVGPRPWLVVVSGAHPSVLSPLEAVAFDCRLDKPVEPAELRELLEALATAGPPGALNGHAEEP
jgi:CheY-like chemotaxis protein